MTAKYILTDSHGRIYNMRDWESLQVPALAYDRPGMNETWTELSHELNIKLVSGNNEKKTNKKTKKTLCYEMD